MNDAGGRNDVWVSETFFDKSPIKQTFLVIVIGGPSMMIDIS
jgi:hypothetical protein